MPTYDRIPLGQVCAIDPRARRAPGFNDDTMVSFVPMSAVDERTATIAAPRDRRLAEVSKGYTAFEDGDILFAKITPCMENGKVALAKSLTNGIGRGSTEFFVLRPQPRILPEYVYHFVRQPVFRELARRHFTGTAGQQRVPKSFMETASIPVPPHDRQRKIIAVLELADNIRHQQTRVADCLRDFSSALFSRLFGAWSDYTKRWEIAALDEVATVTAGDPAPQNREAFGSTGPLFVRMQDVGRDHVNSALSVSKDRLAPGWLQRNRLRLFPAGSILIPKSGASVNLNHRAMLATDAHVVSHLAVITPDPSKVDPHYLFWWSVGYDPREQVQVTSLPSLKLATLKEATLPLPPLDEQRRFSRVAKRASHITTKIEAASQKAMALRESLMARLFGDEAGS